MQARIMFDHRHKKTTQTPRRWERGEGGGRRRKQNYARVMSGETPHMKDGFVPPFFFLSLSVLFFFSLHTMKQATTTHYKATECFFLTTYQGEKKIRKAESGRKKKDT